MLGPRLAALARLSAALGTGDGNRLRGALADCGPLAPSEEIEEVILQAYLFIGFPRVLEAMRAWREIDRGRSARTARVAPQSAGDLAEWRRRGVELCRTIYGSAYEKLRGNVRRLHPDLDRWMIEEGYGKVLSRPGLDTRDRELCIVALLAVQDAEPQLHSHLRGAGRVGAVPQDVEEALSVALSEGNDARRSARVWRLWERVGRRSDQTL